MLFIHSMVHFGFTAVASNSNCEMAGPLENNSKDFDHYHMFIILQKLSRDFFLQMHHVNVAVNETAICPIRMVPTICKSKLPLPTVLQIHSSILNHSISLMNSTMESASDLGSPFQTLSSRSYVLIT